MWVWPPSRWCPTSPTRRGRWRRSASSTGAPRPSATWTPPSSGATSSPSYPAASWVRLTYALPNGISTVCLAVIYCRCHSTARQCQFWYFRLRFWQNLNFFVVLAWWNLLSDVLHCQLMIHSVLDEFWFTSRRVEGFPFSLTVFVNKQCHVRLSACCESKRIVGTRQGIIISKSFFLIL